MISMFLFLLNSIVFISFIFHWTSRLVNQKQHLGHPWMIKNIHRKFHIPWSLIFIILYLVWRWIETTKQQRKLFLTGGNIHKSRLFYAVLGFNRCQCFWPIPTCLQSRQDEEAGGGFHAGLRVPTSSAGLGEVGTPGVRDLWPLMILNDYNVSWGIYVCVYIYIHIWECS